MHMHTSWEWAATLCCVIHQHLLHQLHHKVCITYIQTARQWNILLCLPSTPSRSRALLYCKGHMSLSIIIYPLTARVIGSPQMLSKSISSIFPCSQLPSGTWRTPSLSIPWCLPTSSSICLVFFPLSMCLARWIWPDLMNRRHDHTTTVCVSLLWSGGLHVVWLPAGSWHGLPHW